MNLRHVYPTLALAGVCWAATPETAQSPEFALPDGGILFNCIALPSDAEPGNSDISVSHDTVSFELYFVDVSCTKIRYAFEKRKNVLVIQRVTTPPDTCDRNSEQLYGLKGMMRNVPPGKYLLELESVIGEARETIFHDVVKVK